MFRQSGIPKRLIPGTIALGAFTFTMDALPGTPQIQNIIPTTFFKHQHLGRSRGSASSARVHPASA
jgi:H+/gluconate symporter-like permease